MVDPLEAEALLVEASILNIEARMLGLPVRLRRLRTGGGDEWVVMVRRLDEGPDSGLVLQEWFASVLHRGSDE